MKVSGGISIFPSSKEVTGIKKRRNKKVIFAGGAHFTDIVNWLSKFKKSPWQSSHTVQTGAHRTARPSSAYRYRLGR